jgi:acyl-coenzyme A thioesterase PaaI-like protein
MLGRAAIAAGGQPHVLAASAHYLRPPDTGAVEITVDVLRDGRSIGQSRARMLQGDEVCVEALVTTGALDGAAEPFWTAGLERPEIAPRAQSFRVPSTAPGGMAVPIMDQVDLRLDPADSGFARGAPTGRGMLRGWLELPDGEPFDSVALLYAIDAFPPATFDVAMTGWVPTLELTGYVRALPAPGPVQIVHKAQVIDGGRVDEVCFIWDAAGRLVAQGTQLAAIRVG